MATVAYATVTELRGQINMTSTSDDTYLALLLEAASQAIDNYCNRPDGFLAAATAAARVYAGSGKAVQRIDECAAISTVAVKDSPADTTYTAWASTDWQGFAGHPRFPDYQPAVKGKPYTGIMVTAGGDYSIFTKGIYEAQGVPTVQVTARWGYAIDTPPEIKQACITQAARWYKRGQSAWADATGNPELGQLMYTKSLDPAVKLILDMGRFVRPAI